MLEHAYGWLSIIPPLIAITLAVTTKDVFGSLLVGIISGYAIYVNFAPPSILATLEITNPVLGPLNETVNAMLGATSNRDNLALLFFLAMLGGLVAILTAAGGSKAFAKWATTKIKSKRAAQLATFALGCVIFIDDYFNALTVGNVMRPITDRYKISRAKLAYIIDSTAAPVTILFPVSSWVATVISLINPSLQQYGFKEQGLGAFMSACPFNYYAWLTLLMVVLVATLNVDFGPMARFERISQEQGSDAVSAQDSPDDEMEVLDVSDKGTAWDLILSIVVLVALALLSMLYTGGFFDGVPAAAALSNCDSSISLVYAGTGTLIFTLFLFVPRKLMTIKQFIEAFVQGIKSMVSAIFMLILAWTFASVLSEGVLSTGSFVAGMVAGNIPGFILPVIIFLLSAFIAFTTGVSWGAMAIMLPTSIAVCAVVAPEHIAAVLGATLAGSVYGDHCSPLADTTILSSAGASCVHLDHVMSQLPYANVVAGISLVGFLVAGLTFNPWIPMAVCVLLLIAVMLVIHYRIQKRDARLLRQSSDF